MLDLSPEHTSDDAAFARLQSQLEPRFLEFRADHTRPYTAVVVPSQSLDPEQLAKISGIAHYEERSLFNLMLLRHPRLELIFITSKRLNPLTVDYYLHQIRAVPSEHARRRLTLLDTDDASPRALSQKILERPRLLQRIRDSIRDPAHAHLSVFNSTRLESKLALALGIPLNACDPNLTYLGSKSSGRKIFADAGMARPPGAEDLRDARDVAETIVDLKANDPGLAKVVVKLNEGFSGEGNAVLSLRDDKYIAGSRAERVEAAIAALGQELHVEADGLSREGFFSKFQAMQGVCEAWISAAKKYSPSVQLRINPAREVQLLSTHDQELGGNTGQVYMGATFPARAIYRMDIQHKARAIAEILTQKGVLGRFGVDFLVGEDQEGHQEIYASEINLRQGGTTHPFNTVKLITGGHFDEETGTFFTAQGHERMYYCTDTLHRDAYRGIMPYDLLDALVERDILFRPDETGVIFHLLGCISEFGKLGCTVVEKDLRRARKLFAGVTGILDDLAQANADARQSAGIEPEPWSH